MFKKKENEAKDGFAKQGRMYCTKYEVAWINCDYTSSISRTAGMRTPC